MDSIFFYIGKMAANNIILFFMIFFASQRSIDYLGQLIVNKKYLKLKEIILCSALNGFLLTAFSNYLGDITPIVLLIVTPTIIVTEVFVLTRDKFFTYIYYWVKFLCNFFCIYWITVSVVGLVDPQYIKGEIILSITVFLSGWWCHFLINSKWYPTQELKIIVHNKQAGSYHFWFFVITTISQLFSTVVLRPILVNELVYDEKTHNIFYMEMFLKTGLIFFASYLILFMKAREIREKENTRLLSVALEKEENFRKSTWQNTFLSFCVNITGNQIQEGRDYFTSFMWKDVNNYAEMLQKMVFYCVHPEDYPEFVNMNNISIIEEDIKKGNISSKQNIRVSPKGMIRLFHMPDKMMNLYNKIEETWVWIRIDYVYIIDSTTKEILTYISMTDIHEEKKRNEELMIEATTDKLTGIYNRAALQRRVSNRILWGKKEQKSAGTMILIDVDNFKSVNDFLGHPVGDVALQEVAAILKEMFRTNDIIGRLGGDEFCVFMNDVTDEAILCSRLAKLNEKCRKDYPVEGREPIPVSVSIGAVICSPEIMEYEQLYQYADMALYSSKEKGKNTFSIYGKDSVSE